MDTPDRKLMRRLQNGKQGEMKATADQNDAAMSKTGASNNA